MDLTEKTILITGGAGAIGGRLSQRLSKNSEVIVLDNLSSGYIENVPKECVFIDGNITDNYQLEYIFKNNNIDVVFHLAAFFANQNSVEHPLMDLSTNGAGTLNLLEFSLRYRVKKFIYTSSSCVDSKNKITPYAITKHLGEEYVNLYHRLHGLNTVILRYYNSYGPGDRPGKYRSVIPNFIDKALKNEDILITGTGEETRDFTFVDDIVDGTILSAENDISNGKSFSIGTGQETTILDLVRKIKKLTNSKSRVVFQKSRKWDSIKRRVADIGKTRDLLGYSPKIDLFDGLKRTLYWLENEID